MRYDNKWLQRGLRDRGYYSGAIDGAIGPQTNAAIVAFKRAHGLRPRPFVGPMTIAALLAELGRAAPPRARKGAAIEPPWLVEISRYLGLHERLNNSVLRDWLASDGATLGDPAKLPWCGDAVATALKKALPKEPWPDALEENPYWARNFAKFGQSCGDLYGAVVVFTRGSGGHVGFLVGHDPTTRRYRVRGGNQGDRIKDSWMDATRVKRGGRVLATRWPKTWSIERARDLPVMDAAGAILSTNEA